MADPKDDPVAEAKTRWLERAQERSKAAQDLLKQAEGDLGSAPAGDGLAGTLAGLMAEYNLSLPAIEAANGCSHPKCLPEFDEQASRLLTVGEIQKRWPRFWGECPDCGENVIAYASIGHYIAGDW